MSEEVLFFEDIIEIKENNRVLSFKTIILENKYIRLTLLPERKKQVFSIFDKRTQLEILDEEKTLDFFIKQSEKEHSKWTNLHYKFHRIGEEDGQLLCFQQAIGLPLIVYKSILLNSQDCTFTLELKCFNTGWEALKLETGISGICKKESLSSSFLWDPTTNTGLSRVDDNCFWEETEKGEEFEWTHLGKKYSYLNPRSWRSWNAKFIPLSKGLRPLKAVLEGSIGFQDDKLSVQSTRILTDHKLILKDDQQQTFEIELDLYPEQVQIFDLTQFNHPIMEGVLRESRSKKDIVWFELYPSKKETLSLEDNFLAMIEAWKAGKEFQKLAECVLSEGSKQSISYHLHALRYMQEQRWSEASELILDALGFHAEDPGLWWLKAICERNLEEASESLENLSYLSPMDPLLEAEKLLSYSLEDEKENLGFNMSEESQVYVVCRYLEAGLWSDAICLIGKYLKIKEVSRLRILLAWSYLHRKEMRLETEFLLKEVNNQWKGNNPWDWIEEKAMHEINESGIYFNRSILEH